MQNNNHQMMGYDRAITMFSPDGRLLQVEYAKTTVKKGSPSVGLRCKDGVVFIVDKRILNKLVVPESVEKIFEVDSHIGVAASGIISDARVLVERAQIRAQQHRITYDTPVDTLGVVKDIASLKQWTTQSGGLRPFGASLIIGGVDATGPRLFLTDPTGIYFEYNAVAIGDGDAEAEELLVQKYKPEISLTEGIQLGVEVLKKILGENFNKERIEAVTISMNDREFTRVPSDQLK